MTTETLFFNSISVAKNEKDVENAYRQLISSKLKDIVFTSPFGCDGHGLCSKTKVSVLCEFKDDLDLSNKSNQIKVLSQSIYYLKKFELSGMKLPSTIFVGDRNECFVMHVNDIFKYLAYNYDWNIAPSNAFSNMELVNELSIDSNINPFVFSSDNVNECLDKLVSLTDGVKRLIPITTHNITEVFKYFEEKVLGKTKLQTNEVANLFIQLLINPDENYLHPVKNRKTLVTKSFGEVSITNKSAFESFFSHFSKEYTPRQKEVLTSIVDRLVQDETRRRKGEFFTPTIWVDKAHEYISSVFGEDWKEKYVVWDPAWGTGNLTRDYKFKELYCSTLNQSDIDTADQMGYNPEAKKFQFDFLNDDYEQLPKSLKQVVESEKEIIFLLNPPYATAKNGIKKKNDKVNAANTKIGDEMKTLLYDKSSAQLFAQFIFRILKKFKMNSNICLFSPSSYKTTVSFKKLRNDIYENHGIVRSFMFDSSHFDSTSGGWAIDFTIIKKDSKSNLNSDILDTNEFDVIKIGEKKFYNTDDKIRASDWIRKIDKIKKPENDFPNLSTPLKINHKKNLKINLEGFIGGYTELSNSVYQNQNGVSLYSAIGVLGNTKSIKITKKNLLYICSMFFAKKSINKTWTNDKDEYLTPNEIHIEWNQCQYDSIVYSLFHIHSFQSSLRQVEYKGQLWDIKNEFFWVSKNKVLDIANEKNYTELYNDARTDSDRYVHKLLFGEERIYDKLSPDAKIVLDKATELFEMSIDARRIMADDTNHLNSWDAGYAQLKLVWKEYFPEQFKEFRELYKKLEDRMRPLVYELGFLMK